MTTAHNNHPRWWADTHTSNWDRVKEALHRDWEQTKSDFSGGKKGKELHQDVGDTLGQAFGKQPIPPNDAPNPPDADDIKKAARAQEKVALKLDDETERGVKRDLDAMKWEDAQLPLRFGHGASAHYLNEWDEAFEPRIRQDWEETYPDQSWDSARPLARQGWDHARTKV
jgi:hypothetical protein